MLNELKKHIDSHVIIDLTINEEKDHIGTVEPNFKKHKTMKLNYGKKGVEINLPDNITWGVLDKEMPFVPKEETEIILSGIESLLEQLDPKINTGCRLLLVVPDHTRRCRLELILPPLIEALEQEFEATIDILVANGSHIIQPEEKVRELLSPKIFDKYPVTQHDYMDADTLLYLGETSFGTPIWLNKKVKEADFIITIGGILYHYFAGFGGGPQNAVTRYCRAKDNSQQSPPND